MIEDLFPFVKNIKFIFAVILIGIIILIVVFSTKKRKSGMCLTIKCKQEKDAAEAAIKREREAALALDDQRKKELADPAAAVFARVSMTYDEMTPRLGIYNPNTKIYYFRPGPTPPPYAISFPYDEIYAKMIPGRDYYNTNTKLYYFKTQ